MNKAEREQVIQDEANAEIAYLAELAAAEAAAKRAAEVEADPQRKVAAEEMTKALRKITEGHQRAVVEVTPEAVKRTFWQWLTQ